jgi:hypothetical protein
MNYLTTVFFVVFVSYASCLLSFVICLYFVMIWTTSLLTQHLSKPEMNSAELIFNITAFWDVRPCSCLGYCDIMGSRSSSTLVHIHQTNLHCGALTKIAEH